MTPFRDNLPMTTWVLIEYKKETFMRAMLEMVNQFLRRVSVQMTLKFTLAAAAGAHPGSIFIKSNRNV
jgi:hypothetical protein